MTEQKTEKKSPKAAVETTTTTSATKAAAAKTPTNKATTRFNDGHSFVANKATAEAARTWFVVDATDRPLGRLASEIAHVLRGKHKPTFTTHVDTGDFVVVVNANKVKLTGTKLDGKFYNRHSGIPGGFRAESYRHLLERKPEFVIEKAVKGMLPKNVLGREMITKLKVYATADHPHAAQKPAPLPVNKVSTNKVPTKK